MISIISGQATALLVSALLATGCAGNKTKEGEENSAAAKQQTEAKAPEAAQKPDEAAPEAAKTAQPSAVEPLAEGTPAPDFTAPAHDGTTVQLSKLQGKPVVLYFYPKDETPGCTVEAQSFRDEMPDFEQHGATVLGVSLDSIESHKQFAENHNLQFPLLADTEGEIATKYGVSTEGGYARRVTFVIDPKGTIAKVYPQVNVKGHADEVLEVVKSLAM